MRVPVLAFVVSLALAASAAAAEQGRGVATRVTVFGDSAATAMAYDPTAKRILGRGSTSGSRSLPVGGWPC